MNSENRTATTAHTPGPWVVIYSTLARRAGAVLRIEAPGEKGTPGGVSSVVYQNGIGRPASEVGKANARLIAAAPYMLAALETIIAFREAAQMPRQELEFGRAVTVYPSTFDPVLDCARMAVAKATGATVTSHDASNG